MDQVEPAISSIATPRKRAAAFSVHVFTALGAGLALLALLEAVREHWAAMFVWLGAALVIDAADGPIARRLDVMRLQPDWSGEVLHAEEGSLYPALHRMEEAGWVRAQWITKDTGRRARIYELTTAGRKQLESAESRWEAVTSAVNRVLRTV